MSAGTMDFEVKKPAESVALTARHVTPMELLQAAITQNLDTEKLAQLMELQLRWEANEARKAFVEAMNAFKANPPRIEKNKHVKFGQTEYDHATLDHVCDQVTKGLSEHGISHRWRMDEDRPEWIKVTCVLTHKQGHYEETSLGGPPDNSGSKNPMQARAASVTYLQRYTLLAATGLAAANDTDGMSNGILDAAMKEIKECAADKLKETFTKHYSAAKGKESAQKAIAAVYEARKKKAHKPIVPVQGMPLDWGKK